MRRVFVAVPLDEEARHALAERLRRSLGDGLPGRPVRPEAWHLTLRYVGEAADATVDRIAEALEAAPLEPPFPVRWAGLGAFPNARRARVVWVGLSEGEEPMTRLAAMVEDSLGRAGIEPADRPFRPHLTVSRLRPPEPVVDVVEKGVDVGVPMLVDRVTLFESRLRRGGARYRVIEEFPLG